MEGTNNNFNPAVKPDNNLIWAILTTVLCCMPLGVVAIVKASSVDNLWNQGQHEAAIQAAKDAKKWAMIGIGCGVAAILIYIVVYALIISAAVISEM